MVGNTYTGTVSGSHSGTYDFRCIYGNNNTYYFLCLTNLGNVNWYTQCGYSWQVTIQGKTVTAKIPTKVQLDVATQANRAIGFTYRTSTPNGSGHAWGVTNDGSFYSGFDNGGTISTVPLAIF